MKLSYFVSSLINFRKVIIWFMIVALIITLMVLIKNEYNFLSPAARYIYNGILLSN